MKLPAFQFYPGDWRKDPSLCRCSHAAKGGWELVNHADYRMKASKEDEKRATAERVRRHRERVEKTVTCNGKDGQCNGKNDQCNGGVTVDRDIAESESDSEPFLNTFTPTGSAVAQATPSQEKGSNLLENEEQAEARFLASLTDCAILSLRLRKQVPCRPRKRQMRAMRRTPQKENGRNTKETRF